MEAILPQAARRKGGKPERQVWMSGRGPSAKWSSAVESALVNADNEATGSQPLPTLVDHEQSRAESKKRDALAFRGLTACLLVLVSVVALALWLHRERDEAFGWVDHTHDVSFRIQQLLSLVQDAETGQRGYLLTGEAQYLRPFERSSAAISSRLESLRTETADNPNQQFRLHVLEELITEKFDELQETIDRRATDPSAALDVVMTHRGLDTMDRIRHVIRQLTVEEERLLSERIAMHASVTQRISLLLIAVAVLVVATAVFAIYQLWQEMARRRRLEDQRRLMLDELDHRVKNNLATILAISRQTLENVSSLDEFDELFSGRIHAMARVHEALAIGKWDGADMDEIVELTIGPYELGAPGRVEFHGDPRTLSARVSSRLGMALHELMTNAAKYGALSASQGRVEVKWASDPNGMLRVLWSEIGGPEVAPPVRKGLGTMIIKDTIEHDLAGQVDMLYRSDGLVCKIDIPEPGLDDSTWPQHRAA